MMRGLRYYLNIKVFIGGVAFAVVIFAILVGILWSSKAKSISQVPATAILSIIRAPTETLPAPAVTPTQSVTPTTSPNVPTPGGNISIGDYVQVSGTGGDGLRLHESAGVSSKVRYIAIEAEVFIVKDGPNESDGYVWWYLQDPYTENAAGWGVANYLVIVRNP